MMGSTRFNESWKYCLICGKHLSEHISDYNDLDNMCLQLQMIALTSLSEKVECPDCSSLRKSVELELNISGLLECVRCRRQYEFIPTKQAHEMRCGEVINLACRCEEELYGIPQSHRGAKLYKRDLVLNDLAYFEHNMRSTQK